MVTLIDFIKNVEDEVFEITHKMGSRQILVNGAIAMGKKLVEQTPGFYSIDQLMFG